MILKDIILLAARVIEARILAVVSPKLMSIELADVFLVQRRTDCMRTRPEQLKELDIVIELGRITLIISPV